MSEPSATDARRASIRNLAVVLMRGALLSKLLGFVRELIMAQIIGASLVADGFRGALTAVMLPLTFLQNESVPAILIPMHQDAQREGAAPRTLTAITVALTSLAAVLMLCVQGLGEWWVGAVVGGFVPQGQALTLEFVRIMALGMPASVMLNCLAAGELALGRSRIANMRASVLNIAAIVGLGVLSLTGAFSALPWSFAIAFNGLAAWSLWRLGREGQLTVAGLSARVVADALVDFFRRLRPLLVLPLAEQGQTWVERALASRIATGALASLDYARTLTESAVLLISQPIGLAVLSNYSSQDAKAQTEAIVRPVLALAVPASVFLYFFAPEVIRFLFMRGAFSEDGVVMTSQALQGISVGLWAGTLGWILLRILNGAQRNGLAALILVGAYCVNIAVNLLTTRLPAGAGLFYLGLGEAARSFVLLGALVLALEGRARLLSLIALSALPALVMGVLGWQIHEKVTGLVERLVAGGAACVVSIIVGLVILMPALRREGVRYLRQRLMLERKT